MGSMLTFTMEGAPLWAKVAYLVGGMAVSLAVVLTHWREP